MDKQLYRERRAKGLRGQGEPFNPMGQATGSLELADDNTVVMKLRGQAKASKSVTKKALLKNTKRARRLVQVNGDD